jgi:hypothetical protein
MKYLFLLRKSNLIYQECFSYKRGNLIQKENLTKIIEGKNDNIVINILTFYNGINNSKKKYENNIVNNIDNNKDNSNG